MENRNNMENDKVNDLETQLGQARIIAEESDKKYEEVRSRFEAQSQTCSGTMYYGS